MKYLVFVLFTLSVFGCKSGPSTQPDPLLTDNNGDATPKEVDKTTPPKEQANAPVPSAQEVLALFCPEDEIQDGGCKVCTDESINPTPWDGLMTVGEALGGSFTEPGVVEALVELRGCGREPSDNNETALLRRNEDGEWVAIDYFMLWTHEQCTWVTTPKGTSAGVCETFLVRMGELTTAYWQALFDGGELEVIELHTATNDAAMCPESEVIVEEAKLEKLGDGDNDGFPEVTISYVNEVFSVPDGASDACDAEDKGLKLVPKRAAEGVKVFVLGDDGRFRERP